MKVELTMRDRILLMYFAAASMHTLRTNGDDGVADMVLETLLKIDPDGEATKVITEYADEFTLKNERTRGNA